MPKNMPIMLASAAGAALLLAGAATMVGAQHGQIPPPDVTFISGHEAVPFELYRGNRIFVPAAINGHHTPVLLDTGASRTTVDRAFARFIGLPEGQKISGHGPGGDVQAEIVPNVTLDVGGVHFTNITVAVMDLTPIARTFGRPLNIVVGREFFNASVVSIDWADRRLRVSSHEAFRPSAGANALDLKRRGPFNLIPVAIAGAPPIDALFDLGSGGSLTLPPTYWKGRPELLSLRTAGAMVGGVGGRHGAHATTVSQVRLAGTTFTDVPTLLADVGNDQDAAQMANVGIGFMKQFKVDLDLGHDRVYLTRRSDAPAFERDRAGVLFDLEGDRLKAAYVSPESPAATAGLKQGDEVVAIDGRTPAMVYSDPVDWSKGPPGTDVVLTRADGSKVTVKLANYY